MLFNTEKIYCPVEYRGKCCLDNLKTVCRHRCVLAVNKKAMQRLRELPEEQQSYIAEKYYCGIIVWSGKKAEF